MPTGSSSESTPTPFHCYAIVEAGTGRVLDEATFPTSRAGLARAADWIGRRTAGQVEAVLVSCEGTGSYGARLTTTLLDLGYRVVDAPSPKRERGDKAVGTRTTPSMRSRRLVARCPSASTGSPTFAAVSSKRC